MRALFDSVFALQLKQMVDSSLETTRVFWRQKYFNATEAEAFDPRPFAVVLEGRALSAQERDDGR